MGGTLKGVIILEILAAVAAAAVAALIAAFVKLFMWRADRKRKARDEEPTPNDVSETGGIPTEPNSNSESETQFNPPIATRWEGRLPSLDN